MAFPKRRRISRIPWNPCFFKSKRGLVLLSCLGLLLLILDRVAQFWSLLASILLLMWLCYGRKPIIILLWRFSGKVFQTLFPADSNLRKLNDCSYDKGGTVSFVFIIHHYVGSSRRIMQLTRNKPLDKISYTDYAVFNFAKKPPASLDKSIFMNRRKWKCTKNILICCPQ